MDRSLPPHWDPLKVRLSPGFLGGGIQGYLGETLARAQQTEQTGGRVMEELVFVVSLDG